MAIPDCVNNQICGVWVLDMVVGKSIGFLHFKSGVQEIFTVQVLPNVRYPELIVEDDNFLDHSLELWNGKDQ